MGISRRAVIEGAGGAGLLVAGAAAGYLGGKLMDGKRDAVPGFEWSDSRFAPFHNDSLRATAPHYPGDKNPGRGRYDTSRTVALLGAFVDQVADGLTVDGRRLGIAYTDPGGNWHQGYGQPGQLFGGVVRSKDGPLLTAALGIGPNDVEFSWVLRDESGVVVPLASLAINGAAMSREDAFRQFPGVPQL